ncbi:MAG: methylmalonyl-CoA epimerase [Planctomycetes bacterium]|nr:methylmalonyl-CoA epimerase [Planctomycetota bacterium]MBL7009072.1 methylmalonyl-CoA epimerase [Planctomycetota bacterium]
MNPALGIDHIAIAVDDLEEATRIWRDLLGLREGARETVADQGVEVQMMYAGETRVELMRPTRPDSPVGAFLAKRGPGLHHLALAVGDCASAVSALARGGARLIDAEPRPGAAGTRIAFVHPKSVGGVLTELVEGGAGPRPHSASMEETPE